jgi:hypothetical protein
MLWKMSNLKNKTMFVIRGTGREMALHFACDGTDVVVTGKTADARPMPSKGAIAVTAKGDGRLSGFDVLADALSRDRHQRYSRYAGNTLRLVARGQWPPNVRVLAWVHAAPDEVSDPEHSHPFPVTQHESEVVQGSRRIRTELSWRHRHRGVRGDASSEALRRPLSRLICSRKRKRLEEVT